MKGTGGWLSGPAFWLGLLLAACGGRTIEDRAYDTPGSSGGKSDRGCSYNGVTVVNGSLVADPCVCVCDDGQFQCQSGCDGAGGPSAGGSGPISGGSSSVVGGSGPISAGATSGGAASGGAIGMAGAPAIFCGAVLRATGQQPLIDDMEDDDDRIALREGRSGAWFTYNDATPGGDQFPAPGSLVFPMDADMNPLSGGRFVASTFMSGFTTWGAGMGVVLDNSCPYDAGAYKGVRFFARASRQTLASILFPTAATNPPSAGGTCQELTGHSCFDSYQSQVGLTQSWQEFYLDFAILTQQGRGQPVVFDAKKLIGINFQIASDPGTTTIKVDDVSFY